MIPYTVYKLLHLVGIFLLFSAVGGIALHALNGGTRQSNTARRLVAAIHGGALFVILLGGFGMLARLQIVQGMLPGWVWGKLLIWGAMVFIAVLPYRRPRAARWVLLASPLLAGAAAYLALYKPF